MSRFTLLQASSNTTYRIKNILGKNAQVKRLLDMGFVPRKIVFIKAFSPFASTVLVKINGFSVALSPEIARMVEIESFEQN